MPTSRFNAVHPRGQAGNKGQFKDAAHGDPGTDMLTVADGRPTVEDLHTAQHPAGKVFTMLDRCIKPGLYESDRHYRFTLNEGHVYGTDGYVLAKVRCTAADGCKNIGLDCADARDAATIPKGEGGSEGLLYSEDGCDLVHVGGHLVNGARPKVQATQFARIMGKFQPDWDDAAMPGRPENWEPTDDVVTRYKGSTVDQMVDMGTSQFPARRLERAMKVMKGLGIKSVLIETQSQKASGVTAGRMPLVRITGAGAEIIIMGVKDRNLL